MENLEKLADKDEKIRMQDSEDSIDEVKPEILESHAFLEKPGTLAQPNELPANQKPLTKEEQNWAMLAHLSILLNLATGFLGGIAALIIYLIYKERSHYIAYHAMQSFLFQSITWIGASLVGSTLIAIGGTFWFLILPLILVLIGLIILLLVPASLIYGIIGAVDVSNGRDFRYWQVGSWVRHILENEN
jgi:uncharacterized Tic20 family protein